MSTALNPYSPRSQVSHSLENSDLRVGQLDYLKRITSLDFLIWLQDNVSLRNRISYPAQITEENPVRAICFNSSENSQGIVLNSADINSENNQSLTDIVELDIQPISSQQSEDFHNAQLIMSEFRKIETLFAQQIEDGSISLEDGAKLLPWLKKLYTKTNADSQPEDVANLLSLTERLESIVREKNALSPVFTHHDANMIGSFFKPPIEQYYTDPDDGQVYELGDYSHLLRIALPCVLKSTCYKAEVEIAKCLKLTVKAKVERNKVDSQVLFDYSSRCDVIFLKKTKTQIRSENSSFYGLFYSEQVSAIKEEQKKVIGEIRKTIEKNISSWKYAKLFIFNDSKLMEQIVGVSDPDEYHAFVLILNPISTYKDKT